MIFGHCQLRQTHMDIICSWVTCHQINIFNSTELIIIHYSDNYSNSSRNNNIDNNPQCWYSNNQSFFYLSYHYSSCPNCDLSLPFTNLTDYSNDVLEIHEHNLHTLQSVRNCNILCRSTEKLLLSEFHAGKMANYFNGLRITPKYYKIRAVKPK